MAPRRSHVNVSAVGTKLGWGLFIGLSGAFAGPACGPDTVPRQPTLEVAAVAGSARVDAPSRPGRNVAPERAQPSAADAAVAPVDPRLTLLEPNLLSELENSGLDLGTVAFDVAPHEGRLDNRALMANVGFASIVGILRQDLDEVRRKDKLAGVGMRFAHRLFDAGWLSNPRFHFELVAVVNRLDRRVFSPSTCGELRFVFRLAYEGTVKGKTVGSRLPMTINVVRWMNGSCEDWLRATRRASTPSVAGDQLRGWTGAGGPLSSELLSRTSLKSVEVNLQSVRWPSTVRPSMAGHAEYTMRVFRRAGGSEPFVAAPLENTPDVARLQRDPRLTRELSDWLLAPEQALGLAQGTLQVPERYLATKATSIAPHGLARRSNRPYTTTLKDLWKDNSNAVRELRRLDQLSCPGCHQSRSIAGFHLLGEEPREQAWDRLFVPHSPHFGDELERRERYVRALFEGQTPNEDRPPAERPIGAGGWGSRCGVDPRPGAPFADWVCDDGLVCRAIDDPHVGECSSPELAWGDPCEPGIVAWSGTNGEAMRLEPPGECGNGRVCERNGVGFPGGMCSGGCEGLGGPEAVCGGIAVLDSFNACLARGEVFGQCLATTTRPGALRRCSRERPCRDDYVCAATADGSGACLPPYFSFQLRVDGHVY